MDETHFGKGSTDKAEDFLQARAWRHEEIAGAFQPAPWVEKKPGAFITYPKRNQGNQSSCVLYTLAKQLAVDEFSENGIYRELSPRSVYPYVVVSGGGSNSLVATRYATKMGMTLEALLPTDGLQEADAENDKGYATDAKQIALVYKPQSFIECSSDFETLASILYGYQQQNQKKVIGATLLGTNNGTWLSPFPKPPKTYVEPNIWVHRITIADFGLIGGKKHIAIDNSWGEMPGIGGQQYLSEEYAPYLFGAIYTLNSPDNWQQLAPLSVPPPKYQWNVDLFTGSTGPDVTALQIALQSMGMFPVSSVVKPTGNFFGVTRKAVELFQASFGIPVTGVADAQTRAQLNIIFKV